jgi:ubiquinone biosynthesis protein
MAKLLTLLFEVTALLNMTTVVELVTLQKTLDPQPNMWSTAELVAGDQIADDLSPPAGSTT